MTFFFKFYECHIKQKCTMLMIFCLKLLVIKILIFLVTLLIKLYSGIVKIFYNYYRNNVNNVDFKHTELFFILWISNLLNFKF